MTTTSNKTNPFSLLLAAVLFFAATNPCRAEGFHFDFFQSTYLLEVSQTSDFSNLIVGFRSGGFEKSDGGKVSFDKWYSSKWVDTKVGFLTQLSQGFGVLWGLSTGERGEKYVIQPSFKYGFLYRHAFTRESNLYLSATTIVGGRLKERSCTADYGEIGGVQEVNCRLAATEMEPSETLNYLINQAPPNKNQISIRYSLNF